MHDLLQKAVKLGLDAPKCQAPGCYRGRLSDCRECLACHGTGLDADPARVLMAVVMWQFKRGSGFDGVWEDCVWVYAYSSVEHNGTPEGLATAALRAVIEAAS